MGQRGIFMFYFASLCLVSVTILDKLSSKTKTTTHFTVFRVSTSRVLVNWQWRCWQSACLHF